MLHHGAATEILENLLEHYRAFSLCPLYAKSFHFLYGTMPVVAPFDYLIRKYHDSIGTF